MVGKCNVTLSALYQLPSALSTFTLSVSALHVLSTYCTHSSFFPKRNPLFPTPHENRSNSVDFIITCCLLLGVINHVKGRDDASVMLSAVELIVTEFVVVAAICFLLLRYYAAAMVSADIR